MSLTRILNTCACGQESCANLEHDNDWQLGALKMREALAADKTALEELAAVTAGLDAQILHDFREEFAARVDASDLDGAVVDCYGIAIDTGALEAIDGDS